MPTVRSTVAESESHSNTMELIPIDTPEMVDLVSGWLSQKKNYQMLDFGTGIQIVTSQALKIMTQRDIHFLRLFTPDGDSLPIGVVGLSNISRNFKTATLWIVLGDKKYSAQGYAVRASSAMLTIGFTELGLHVVDAWTVERNVPVIRGLRQLHFRYIGRQRQCHYIDGRAYDRLWFDLLDSEHQEVQTGPAAGQTTVGPST